jgi:hypothetical protein
MNIDELKEYCDHFDGINFLYDKALEVINLLPEQYPILEIGTRCGGTSLLFLKAILDSNKKERFLITVDPFGEMPYEKKPNNYGEDLYRTSMYKISEYCFNNKLNHAHFRLTSIQFFHTWKLFKFWHNGKLMEKEFSFIYFDGDHSDNVVNKELYLYYQFIIEQGVFCIDDQHDIEKYSNIIIEKPIMNSNRLYYCKSSVK